MIQKHCSECGAVLVWKELEGEGTVPYCPIGRSVNESMLRNVELDAASDYEKAIISACKDCRYDKAVNMNNLCRALEEAEFLGMMVAIVPDPEFQPGGSREGQCDGWSYHPEVVTKEKYDRMYPAEEDTE